MRRTAALTISVLACAARGVPTGAPLADLGLGAVSVSGYTFGAVEPDGRVTFVAAQGDRAPGAAGTGNRTERYHLVVDGPPPHRLVSRRLAGLFREGRNASHLATSPLGRVVGEGGRSFVFQVHDAIAALRAADALGAQADVVEGVWLLATRSFESRALGSTGSAGPGRRLGECDCATVDSGCVHEGRCGCADHGANGQMYCYTEGACPEARESSTLPGTWWRECVVAGYPDDPFFHTAWHLRNVGQRGVAGVDTGAFRAWGLGYTGRGVTVAVVDDGMDLVHPDLVDRALPALGYNWNAEPPNRDPSPSAWNSHGTAVAGLLGASRGNGEGAAGVAPGAGLVGFRFIAGPIDVYDELDAFSRGNDAIDIKSNSWGPPDQMLYGPSRAVVRTLAEAVRTGRGGRGTVFVFAAGNGGPLRRAAMRGVRRVLRRGGGLLRRVRQLRGAVRRQAVPREAARGRGAGVPKLRQAGHPARGHPSRGDLLWQCPGLRLGPGHHAPSSQRRHLCVQVYTGPRLPGASPPAVRGQRGQRGATVPFVGRGHRGLGIAVPKRPPDSPLFFLGGGRLKKRRRPGGGRGRRAARGASLLWRGRRHHLERAVRDARPCHRLGHSAALDVAL